MSMEGHFNPSASHQTVPGHEQAECFNTQQSNHYNKTRWVDGTPTSEITPITIQIFTPHLGHQQVMVMVMNDWLPSLLFNVKSMVVKGQGHTVSSATNGLFLFIFTSINPAIPEIQPFKNFTLKIQGHDLGKKWLHLKPSILTIFSLFVLWQSNYFVKRYSKFHIWPWKFLSSINMFAFHFVAIRFWLRYNKF